MGPFFVVVAAPRFDQDRRLGACSKPFEVEALVSKLSVKALVESVLPGLARSNEGCIDVIPIEPPEYSERHEFWPVVGAYDLGCAAHADESCEHFDDAWPPKTSTYVNRETFTRVFVDDG